MSKSQNERSKAILVMNDHPSVLVALRAMLESSHYVIVPATTAETALRLAGQPELDINLAVLDTVMPGSNLVEFVKRILVIRPDMKMLFVNGRADAEMVCIKVVTAATGYEIVQLETDDLRKSVDQMLSARLVAITKPKTFAAGC